ncbi:MAG: hypothetical protein M3022_01110 [Actinomycetota bacterium]|nr:hypothetical protein [Actinomycetota bacterium]
MRSARALVTVTLVLGVGGCGSVSPIDQVGAKVRQFATATDTRNPRVLCDQVLAPALVNRLTAAGLSCRQAMKVFVSSVSHPTLSVSKVSVSGATASAGVRAGAAGQAAALESVQLVRTAQGWRLVSLAAPRWGSRRSRYGIG